MVDQRSKARLLARLALVLVALAVPRPAAAHGEAAGQDQNPADFDGEMHLAMQTMMASMEAAPMGGSPEEDFLVMMIPHHQGAIDMARAVLVYGRDPLVRQLAEEIIATQQVEIQSMQNRLAALRAGRAPDPAADQSLGGTRGGIATTEPPTQPHSMDHH